MGGGHSSPAYIPQKIINNPNMTNKTNNPSSFIYKEGFYGYKTKRRFFIIPLLLLLFLLFINFKEKYI